MESVTNIVIGLVVSTIANWLILPAVLGVSMTLGQNVLIGLAFTAISLVRSYVIRRAFNGRSVWASLKAFHQRPYRRPYWMMPLMVVVFLIYYPADRFTTWVDRNL